MNTEKRVRVECECKFFGHNDRARLKEFQKLPIVITDTNLEHGSPTEIEVDGYRCTVCDRIELDPGSFMAVNTIFNPVPGSLYTQCTMIAKIIVEDPAKNIRYDGFKLFLSGKSDVL